MSRTARAAAVLDAAERWKQRCLVDGRSLFGEERLWTGEHFGELQTYFVEQAGRKPEPVVPGEAP